MAYHVAKLGEAELSIFHKSVDCVLIQPSSLSLQGLRQITVVEGYVGFYAVVLQRLKNCPVELHPLLVHNTSTFGQDSRPGYGHVVGGHLVKEDPVMYQLLS